VGGGHHRLHGPRLQAHAGELTSPSCHPWVFANVKLSASFASVCVFKRGPIIIVVIIIIIIIIMIVVVSTSMHVGTVRWVGL